MRKLILFNMITLDGYFEGPDRDIDWHSVDDEFNEFAIEQLNAADGIIFGRITYVLMASYWPTPAAMEDDPDVAAKMNSISKFVVSRTLEMADWNNTRLVSEDAAGEIARLKEQPGKDLLIFGSADLASTLTNHGLIDEYRLIVNPVVLGQGRPLFEGIKDPFHLKLLKSRTFQNGNVLLIYEPLER